MTEHQVMAEALLPCRDCGNGCVDLPQLSQSPWPERLGRMSVPSPIEAKSIRSVISGAKSDIFSLKSDMDRLLSAVMQLRDRHNKIQKYIDDHEALIAPVRHLPDEIMTEIFIHCLPPHSKPDGSSSGRRGALLALTQVCSRWRSVAISSAELWSSLRIDFKETNLARSVSVMESWLARSSQYPLLFGLHSLQCQTGWSIRTVFNAVSPFFNRFEHLTLHVPATFLDELVQGKDTFPLLQSLRIQLRSSAKHLNQPPWNILDNSPRLRAVHLHHVLPSQFILPWAQLTHFESGRNIGIQSTVCLDIIKSAPNLRHCSFEDVVENDIPTGAPFLHPNLRFFRFSADTCQVGLFKYLAFPALSSIELECGSDTIDAEEERFAHEFIGFILRSACHIERFVAKTKFSFTYLEEILNTLPQLYELHIGGYPSASGLIILIGRLNLSKAPPPHMCPVLRSFHLLNDPPLGSNPHEVNQPLVDMVQSRWTAGSDDPDNHFSVRMVLFRRVNLNSFVQWKGLKEKGLNVSIEASDGVDLLSALVP